MKKKTLNIGIYIKIPKEEALKACKYAKSDKIVLEIGDVKKEFKFKDFKLTPKKGKI